MTDYDEIFSARYRVEKEICFFPAKRHIIDLTRMFFRNP